MSKRSFGKAIKAEDNPNLAATKRDTYFVAPVAERDRESGVVIGYTMALKSKKRGIVENAWKKPDKTEFIDPPLFPTEAECRAAWERSRPIAMGIREDLQGLLRYWDDSLSGQASGDVGTVLHPGRSVEAVDSERLGHEALPVLPGMGDEGVQGDKPGSVRNPGEDEGLSVSSD